MVEDKRNLSSEAESLLKGIAVAQDKEHPSKRVGTGKRLTKTGRSLERDPPKTRKTLHRRKRARRRSKGALKMETGSLQRRTVTQAKEMVALGAEILEVIRKRGAFHKASYLRVVWATE